MSYPQQLCSPTSSEIAGFSAKQITKAISRSCESPASLIRNDAPQPLQYKIFFILHGYGYGEDNFFAV